MHSPSVSLPHPLLLRRIVFGLFCLGLLINIWALTRAWNASLRDGHEFRQNQTALTAYYFKQDGLKLAYETPVLGPPWSIPMEFPLYQAIVAKFSQHSGMPLEQSGRFINIFFFYATLPAVWLLLRRYMPDCTDRLLVVTSILVCPVLLFYSRTFMIESTALCATAWFLWGFAAVLEKPRSWYLPATWILGSLAALTKVTTFAACWIALIAFVAGKIVERRRSGLSWQKSAGLPVGIALLAGLVPLLVGIAWVIYTDHLKAAHPYGQFITSASLRPFNLGTLEQRFSAEWARAIGYITFHQVLAWPGAIVLAVGLAFISSGYRRLALICTAASTGGFLLFANLYFIHDYYHYASSVFLLSGLGIVAAGLLRSRLVPRSIALILIIISLSGEVYAFYNTYYSTFYKKANDPVPFEAEIIKRITPPQDVVAGFGYDWNSLLPYHSQRRAIMPFLSHTFDFNLLEKAMAGLGERRINTVLVTSFYRTDQDFIAQIQDRLQLIAEPILRTPDADIYVRTDRAAATAKIIKSRSDWGGAIINIKPDPSSVILTTPRDLTTEQWAGKFNMMTPVPFLSKGPVEIGVLPLDGTLVISTQAPTELHYHPPAGSNTIEAIGGMVPGSYTHGNTTPGVVLAIFEQLADGTRNMIFERLLNPLHNRHDQGDIVISYKQAQPFEGTLVFGYYAIPSGDVSYSWSYWKRIVIR